MAASPVTIDSGSCIVHLFHQPLDDAPSATSSSSPHQQRPRLGSPMGAGIDRGSFSPSVRHYVASSTVVSAHATTTVASRAGNKGGDDIGPVTLDFTKLVQPGESPLAAYERLSEEGTLRW